MIKPAALFDGRNCLDHPPCTPWGFDVYAIGKTPRVHRPERSAALRITTLRRESSVRSPKISSSAVAWEASCSSCRPRATSGEPDRRPGASSRDRRCAWAVQVSSSSIARSISSAVSGARASNSTFWFFLFRRSRVPYFQALRVRAYMLYSHQ
jgi:hypothetical protein